MVYSIFEFRRDGARFFGLEAADAEGAALLVTVADGTLADALLAVGFDTDALTRALTARPAAPADTGPASLLPPLMPARPTDILVGGFGASHAVKVPPSFREPGGRERPEAYPGWFFKGYGTSIRLSGQDIVIPDGAVAVCEEAEVVLVYITDGRGCPRYIGYTLGNDLTDMGQIKRSLSHLSYAKLCDCAVSSRLFLAPPPSTVTGEVAIVRSGEEVWHGPFTTGLDALFYPVEEMMARLWTHEALRVPGLVHYVFLGADRNSFDHGIRVEDGDRIEIAFAGHDVSLSNTVTRRPAVGPEA